MVVTDLREELVAYVRGVPYLRRELEMPAAALHHAGMLYNTYARRSSVPSCSTYKLCKLFFVLMACNEVHVRIGWWK